MIPRAPISAKCMADLLTPPARAACSVWTCMPLKFKVFQLPGGSLIRHSHLAQYWRNEYGQGQDYVVVSPDAGALSAPALCQTNRLFHGHYRQTPLRT